jgi:hypothetical protein
MPLNWMDKSEKGPISSFIIENLSDIDTIHQYIQGKVNTIPDSCSRYPMLGPKQLATRGFTNSVDEMLRRLPVSYRQADLVHFHGGRNNAELRQALRGWFLKASALLPVSPPKLSPPLPADIAILIPRCEVGPLALAQYLLASTPFALLLPVDLLTIAYSPKLHRSIPCALVEERFHKAGKITILETQMTWVLGTCRTVPLWRHFRTLFAPPPPSLRCRRK